MSYWAEEIDELKNELREAQNENDRLLKENTELRLIIEVQRLELRKLS